MFYRDTSGTMLGSRMELKNLKKCRFFFIFIIIHFTLINCGETLEMSKSKDFSEESLEGLQLVEVPVAFSQGQGLGLVGTQKIGSGLNLAEAEASSFVMKLDGCKSGLESTITKSTFKIYQGDRNCLVKLESFQFLGKTYVPSNEIRFTSWLTEDTSKFVNTENSEDTFFVTVNSQLNQEKASEEDAVAYSFYQAKSGEGYQASIGQSNQASVFGYSAPNYKFSTEKDPISTGSLAPVLFNGINESGGGVFIFNMYCGYPMLDQYCKLNKDDPGVPLADIEYKLIKDTYDVKSGSKIEITELDKIMSDETHFVDVDDHRLVDNNKGFKTVQMDGPDQIHFNPDMVFIIKNHGSYTYFSVRVTLIDISLFTSSTFESCNKDETCLSNLVREKCSTLSRTKESYKIQFERKLYCSWGRNGNLSVKNSYITARETSSHTLELPKGALICKVNEIKSEEQVYFDDWMVLNWNQRLIMSSIDQIESFLEKSGDYYLYDWEKIKGKHQSKYEGSFCYSNNSCSIPGHARNSTLQATFSEEWSQKLSVSLLLDGFNSNHTVNALVYGDDDWRDCQLRDTSWGNIDLSVDLEYVIIEQ